LDLLDKHSTEDIGKQLGISESVVRAHKSRLEQKGYSFRPIFEGKRVIRYEIEGNDKNRIENQSEANF
jgi:biotin operon repressor